MAGRSARRRARGNRNVGPFDADLEIAGGGPRGLGIAGRRRIAGIEPGRTLLASGRVGDHDGRPAMYNPRYELRAPQ